MTKTILYVDDEPWFVEALVDALIDNGYIVEKAITGTEAIAMLSREDFLPNLVILDVIMPMGDELVDTNGGRRTGLKVHEKIRKQLRLRIPIIFLTVVDDPKAEREIEELEKSYGLGTFAILIKPVLPSELLEKATSMLEPQQG